MPQREESVQRMSPVPLGAVSIPLAAQDQVSAPSTGADPRRSMAQILDVGVSGLRDEFGWLLMVSSLVWFPLRLLSLLAARAVGTQELSDAIASIFLTVGNGLAQTLTTALLARRLAQGLAQRGNLLPEPKRSLLRCLPGIFGLGLLTGMATGVGMCMCLVPGIYLAWKLSLAPTVYVLEDCTVGDAVRRTLHLTTASFWRWAGLALSIFVLVGPISSGVGIVEQPEVRRWIFEWSGLSSAGFDWLYAAISSVLLAFATALTAAVMTAYYLDTLVRRDGVDLQADLRRLQAGEAST